MKKINHLKSARKTLKIEAKGLEELAKLLSNDFNDVCNKLLKTCLLYTSPSPRDVEESRMPSSA